MLVEIHDLIQNDFPFHKRWFHSSEAELFIWEKDTQIVGFQFCFDSFYGEIAFSWKRGDFINIHQVDKGKSMGTIGVNESELIMININYDINKIQDKFNSLIQNVPINFVEFINNIFSQYKE